MKYVLNKTATIIFSSFKAFGILNFTNFVQIREHFRSFSRMVLQEGKFFVWQDFDTTLLLNDRSVHIAFDFCHSGKKDRVYMKRAYLDDLAGTKRRLQSKIKDLFNKKEVPEISVRLLSEHGEISDDQTMNFDVFFGQQPCTKIEIGDAEYTVVRDTPWLDNLKIALEPLVGCPLMPSVDWKTKDPIAKYHWFVGSKLQKREKISFDINSKCGISIEGFEFMSTFPYYCPTEEDLNKFIAVVVQFSDEEIGRMAISPIRVKRTKENENDNLIFEKRQEQFCKEILNGNKYRVLSYNVLAHLYIKSALKKGNQENQYFPYCPKEFQYDSYRYPLLLKEINGYNADLLFLQEVDVRFQKRFLFPFLKLKGYTPIFNCKENQVNEGLVICARTDRFSSHDNYTAKLSNLLELSSNSDILDFLKNKPDLYKIISTRPTIIQIIHFSSTENPNIQILAANTHLYFDPLHEDVKFLQTVLCVRYIDYIIKKIKSLQKNDKQNIQVLFAGDFNFTPNSKSAQLLRNDNIKKENDDEDIEKIEAPFKFQCATGFPSYTNFTRAEDCTKESFIGCLDYIWVYPQTKILKVLPMPDHQLVIKYGALPSRIAPSDHLPIICEICLSDIDTN